MITCMYDCIYIYIYMYNTRQYLSCLWQNVCPPPTQAGMACRLVAPFSNSVRLHLLVSSTEPPPPTHRTTPPTHMPHLGAHICNHILDSDRINKRMREGVWRERTARGEPRCGSKAGRRDKVSGRRTKGEL